MTDYSKIILTVEEKTAFDKFKLIDIATITYDEYRLLRKHNLVTASFGGNDPWFTSVDKNSPAEVKLSDTGKRYRAYLQTLVTAPAYCNLSPHDNKVLVYIIKHIAVDSEQIKDKFGDAGNARFKTFVSSKILIPDGTMTDENGNIIPNDKYKISELGRSYMQEYRTERFHYWLPIVLDTMLSVSALVISLLK